MASTTRSSADATLTRALLLFRRASIRVAEGNLDQLLLVLPDHSTVTAVLRVEPHSPSPARIAADVSAAGPDRVLYIVPTAGRAVLAAAAAGRVDVVSPDPDRVIIDGADHLPPPAEYARASRRMSWGRWAVQRVLVLAAHPLNQQELARATGISQQAVSKILRDHPEKAQGSRGSPPESVGHILDTWTQEYPGAGGMSTHWYHLDPVTRQADLVREVARELDLVARPTGDVAADTYAPCRLPTCAKVYVSETIDLTVTGFVSADPGEATLVAQIPRDPTLWSVAKWYATHRDKDGEPLVDPALALWDVMQSPGPDVSDAARALCSAIVAGSLRV